MDGNESDVRRNLQVPPGLEIGTYIWQVAENRLTWSPELLRIYGLDQAPESNEAFLARVHPEDRNRVILAASSLLGTDARHYSQSFRILRPDGSVRVILDRGSIERDAEGRVDTLRGVNVDVTDEANLNYSAERRLRESEERYRKLFEAIDEGFFIVEVGFDRPHGQIDFRVVEANPAYFAHTGLTTDVLGKWMREALPMLEDHWFETFAQVLRTGTPSRFESSADSLGRYFEVYAFPIDAAETQRIAVLGRDITDRKRRETETQLAMDEINHRSKNILGVIQVIAQQTARWDEGEFMEVFGNRIRALSASHDLLVRNAWTTVAVTALVQSQLMPFVGLIGHRVSLEGPPLSLAPVATKALGMALHELATNASKHGALSTGAGRVDIRWWLEGEGEAAQFHFVWRERGGPPVSPPERLGFGSTLITRSVEANMAAKVELVYASAGLEWHAACSADRVLA